MAKRISKQTLVNTYNALMQKSMEGLCINPSYLDTTLSKYSEEAILRIASKLTKLTELHEYSAELIVRRDVREAELKFKENFVKEWEECQLLVREHFKR